MRLKNKLVVFVLLISSLAFLIIAPIATTAVTETIRVPALSYYGYYIDTTADNPTLSISVYAAYDISVYVMDNQNFLTWVSGEDANAYVVKQRIVDSSFQVQLGSRGRYYIILDNRHALLTAKTVTLTVNITYPQQSSAGFLLLLIIIGVFGIGILGILVVIVLVVRPKSKKQAIQPTPPLPSRSPPPPVHSPPPALSSETSFCVQCGNQLTPNQKFCSYCGKERF